MGYPSCKTAPSSRHDPVRRDFPAAAAVSFSIPSEWLNFRSPDKVDLVVLGDKILSMGGLEYGKDKF